MLKLDFTTEQIQALRYERFHHPHPRVRRKMEALLLKSQNLPQSLICTLVGVSANTLRNYFREFQNGGVEALQELDFYRPTSQLDAHQRSLAEHFRAFPVASIAQAQAEIEKLTGLKRSRTQIRLALLKLGLKRRKVGSIPAKADLEKQAAFLSDELQPRLAEAGQGARQIFFSMLRILSWLRFWAGCGRLPESLSLPPQVGNASMFWVPLMRSPNKSRPSLIPLTSLRRKSANCSPN